MHIKNPMNFIEWNSRNFLLILFSIQIAMIGVIGLDLINFQIPLLRQFIGFIYLTFVPGLLLLRILRLHDISLIEKFLFTISLSLITLMLSGFFINTIGFLFIEKPLSFIPIFFTIFLINLIFCIICYIQEKNRIYVSPIITLNFNKTIILPIIYLASILFLTLFGTYAVNYYHSNILLLLDTLFVVSIIFLIAFNKLFPETMYPLVIFIISIFLLYHNSLISPTIYGFDIHQEYYASNIVKTLGRWDPNFPTSINAMLSVVILAPIYSNICNLNLTSVFKIIYPFLFSFTPVGIYLIYQKQINNPKIAFFSTFYFMSIYTYYTEMLALVRQQIAELFLVVIIIVIISNYEPVKKKLLFIIFSLGLIVSHYGLSYLFMLYCIGGYIFLIISNKKSKIISPNYILFFITLTISWYIFMSSGYIFDIVMNLFVSMQSTVEQEFMQTSTVHLVTKTTPSYSGRILRLLYYSSQLFIIIGFLESFIPYINSKIQSSIQLSKEYIAFSIVCLGVLADFFITSCTGMNIYRLFHISSIFLSIFCTLGGLFIFSSFSRIVTNIAPTFDNKRNFKFLSIFLALFLLFNIGFVQEIFNDYPNSVSLSQESIKARGTNSSMFLYRYYIPIQDVYGSTWLSKNRNNSIDTYADRTAVMFVLSSYGMMPGQKDLNNNNFNENKLFNSYIYFRYPNVIYGLAYRPNLDMYNFWNISELSPIIGRKNRIYFSGYNIIYR